MTGSQTNVLEFQPDWLWSKPEPQQCSLVL